MTEDARRNLGGDGLPTERGLAEDLARDIRMIHCQLIGGVVLWPPNLTDEKDPEYMAKGIIKLEDVVLADEKEADNYGHLARLATIAAWARVS